MFFSYILVLSSSIKFFWERQHTVNKYHLPAICDTHIQYMFCLLCLYEVCSLSGCDPLWSLTCQYWHDYCCCCCCYVLLRRNINKTIKTTGNRHHLLSANNSSSFWRLLWRHERQQESQNETGIETMRALAGKDW